MTLRIPPRLGCLATLGLIILITACAGPPPPRYAEIAAQVPPGAVDRARFYFYRDYEPYESLARPYLYLNGQRIGISEPGGVLYRDVAPGTYLVSVGSWGVYPGQFKTLTVKGGDIRFLKIESLVSWAAGSMVRSTFVVAVIDGEQGQREIGPMQFFGGP